MLSISPVINTAVYYIYTQGEKHAHPVVTPVFTKCPFENGPLTGFDNTPVVSPVFKDPVINNLLLPSIRCRNFHLDIARSCIFMVLKYF